MATLRGAGASGPGGAADFSGCSAVRLRAGGVGVNSDTPIMTQPIWGDVALPVGQGRVEDIIIIFFVVVG